MKHSFFFLALYFVVSLQACQDFREPVKAVSPESAAYKTVGEQIPFQTGMRWLEAYRESEQGRLFGPAYEVSGDQLQAAIESTPDFTGIAFHYGMDAWGKKHVIVIPVDATLKLWNPIAGRIILDANNNTPITLTTAQQWTENYKTAYPGEVWFHFFGSDIFHDMFLIPYLSSVDIEPALNDSGAPQMLLVIWNLSLINLLGRTTDQDGTVYDASNACPPCAISYH